MFVCTSVKVGYAKPIKGILTRDWTRTLGAEVLSVMSISFTILSRAMNSHVLLRMFPDGDFFQEACSKKLMILLHINCMKAWNFV